MLNKMSLLLATAAFSLCAGAAGAASLNIGNNNDHRHGNTALSIDFGTVAFGFNDGYWDTGHRWHTWRNNSERTSYRSNHGSNFHGYNHTRDRNNGWSGR